MVDIQGKLANLLGKFPRLLKMALEIVEDDSLCIEVRAIVLGGLIYFVSPYDIIPDSIEGRGYLDDFFVLIFSIELANEFSPLLDAHLNLEENHDLWMEVLEFLKHLENDYPSFYHKMKKSLLYLIQYKYHNLKVRDYFEDQNQLRLKRLLLELRKELQEFVFTKKEVELALVDLGETISYIESHIDNFLRQ